MVAPRPVPLIDAPVDHHLRDLVARIGPASPGWHIEYPRVAEIPRDDPFGIGARLRKPFVGRGLPGSVEPLEGLVEISKGGRLAGTTPRSDVDLPILGDPPIVFFDEVTAGRGAQLCWSPWRATG